MDVATSLADSWRHGKLEIDPKTYLYPTFYMNAVALTLLPFGKGHSAELNGRLVSAITGALASLCVFFIVLRLRNTRSALMAACFSSFGFLFVLQGRHPSPDAPQTLLFLLSLCPLVLDDVSTLALLISGVTIGLAVGTKYTALIFYLPIFIAVMVHSTKNQNSRPIGCVALWSVALAIGFLVATPSFLIRAQNFISELLIANKLMRSGDFDLHQAGVWNFLFSMSAHGQDSPYPNSFLGTLGAPFTIVSLAGMLWACAPAIQKKQDARLFGIGLSCVLGLLYFSFFSKILALRFLLPLASLLTITTAVFIEDVLGLMSRRWPLPLLTSAVLPFSIATVLLIPSFLLATDYLYALSIPDTRLQAAQWIFTNLPPGTKILNFMHGPALPANRYELVHPRLPEYRFELESGNARAWTLRDLDEQQIQCAIWNDFYMHDLLSPLRSGRIADYYRGWSEFKDDLSRRGDPQKYARFPGKISPTIEIFCREGAKWN